MRFFFFQPAPPRPGAGPFFACVSANPVFALTAEEQAVILSSEDWPALRTICEQRCEGAQAFALDAANALYHGNVAHLYEKFGYWHLSRFECLDGPLPATSE